MLRFIAPLLVVPLLVAAPCQARAPVPEPKHAPKAKSGHVDLYGDPLPQDAVARLGSLRLRHYGVEDFTFSPDGKQLISAGGQVVRVWDVATGKPIRVTRLEGGPVSSNCVAISPDGRLFSVTDMKTIHIWDTTTGKKLKRLDGPGPGRQVNYMYFSPDNKTLAVGSNVTTLTLWDWKDAKSDDHTVPSQRPAGPAGVFVGSDGTCQATFSPDSKLLAVSTSSQDPLTIWDVAAGKLLRNIDAQAACFAFSTDNKRLAVVNRQTPPSVRIYDVSNGKLLLNAPMAAAKAATTTWFWWVTWSPDDRTLAASDTTGVALIDAKTGKELRRLQGPGAALQRELYFSPDGQMVAGMAQSAGRLNIWDVATGKDMHPELGSGGDATAAAYSADGRHFATGSAYGGLEIWDVATGRTGPTLQAPTGNRFLRDLSFAEGGRTLIAGFQNGTLEYYDVATGKLTRQVDLNTLRKGSPQYPQFIAFSSLSDGQRLISLEFVSGGQQAINQVSIWDTHLGKPPVSHTFPQGQPYYFGTNTGLWAAFGDYVALRTAAGIVVVDGRSGSAQLRVRGTWGSPLAASPDGRFLAAPDQQAGRRFPGGMVTIIDGRVVRSNPVPRKDAAVHIFETASGKEVVKLTTGSIEHLALAGDGRTLVTSDATGLRIWDLRTRQQRGQIHFPVDLAVQAGQSPINGLYLSPDGQTAITPVAGGTCLIWRLPSQPRVAAKAPLSDAEADKLWEAIEGDDAAKAYSAMWRFADSSDAAVAVVRRHMKPATRDDPKRVQRLLRDLDGKHFRVREAASRDLAALGDAVAPELRRALEKNPPLEVRRRLLILLNQSGSQMPPPETIQSLRAVQILEDVGTPTARALLQQMAAGAGALAQARAAQAALERLNHRPFPQTSRFQVEKSKARS